MIEFEIIARWMVIWHKRPQTELETIAAWMIYWDQRQFQREVYEYQYPQNTKATVKGK